MVAATLQEPRGTSAQESAPASNDPRSVQRRAVATVVSAFLGANLRGGPAIAVGSGRNVAEAAETGNADHFRRALARSFAERRARRRAGGRGRPDRRGGPGLGSILATGATLHDAVRSLRGADGATVRHRSGPDQ